MWFNRDPSQPPGFAFTNGNHKEFLIFRLPVEAVPEPSRSCAVIEGTKIDCRSQQGGAGVFSFAFTLVNNSPFAAPATHASLTSTQATNVTPSTFPFTPVLPSGGTATVSGQFTVANPVPGSQVCLDVKLFGGVGAVEGWCCPSQRVCFELPRCSRCAEAVGLIKCSPQGTHYLELTVTHHVSSTVGAVQVFSTTPGVTVSPAAANVSLPPNTPVVLPPMSVTGATPGQTFNVTVNLHGPVDPATGAFDWCCTATLQVVYPARPCPQPR
jgi:hypothetical protein